MLQSISWIQFVVFLLIATTVYYLAIFIIYFKLLKSLVAIFSPGNPGSKNNAASYDGDDADDPDHLLDQVSKLTSGIKGNIMEAASGHFVREEFLYSLKSMLNQYPALKSTGFQTGINLIIAESTEKKYGIMLSELELNSLWNI
jgi:hypothetical protein